MWVNFEGCSVLSDIKLTLSPGAAEMWWQTSPGLWACGMFARLNCKALTDSSAHGIGITKNIGVTGMCTGMGKGSSSEDKWSRKFRSVSPPWPCEIQKHIVAGASSPPLLYQTVSFIQGVCFFSSKGDAHPTDWRVISTIWELPLHFVPYPWFKCFLWNNLQLLSVATRKHKARTCDSLFGWCWCRFDTN